ncbi:MAG: hypothetical protein ACJAV5_000823 [Vicingaceae bacterium]|jgi:hypothetical protein
MKNLFAYLFFSLIVSQNMYSQEFHLFSHGSYWLTKWDINLPESSEEITILMDTSNSFVENNYNKNLANKIVTDLKNKRFNCIQ